LGDNDLLTTLLKESDRRILKSIRFKFKNLCRFHRNQRYLCQALQNEGVWHFVDPEEPTIMSSYDPTRPNFIPENAVWNRIKPDVEKDLLDYENEIMAELEAKKTVDLERIEEMLNPWIPYPDLTTIYRNRLAGGDAVAHPIIQPQHQPPRRRRRIHRESEPILVETRLRSGRIIRPEEDSAPESDSDDEDSEPEIPPQIPHVPAQPPIHIDPTTLEGFIADQMRVNGNVIEVRAKFALDRIHDNHPIPSVRNPGQAFTAFQENQYRLSALKDIEIAREKALKEIRSHRLELEKASKEWWDDKSDHDEKIAKCSKVFTTRLGEAIIADVRQLLKSHHYRSVWKFLESRSIAMENSGENQELLEDRLRELRLGKQQQLSQLFEQLDDLMDLCRVTDAEHKMNNLKRCFRGCGIKEYETILNLQKHLGLDIDQVKAKLLSEESIMRSKQSDRQHPFKRPPILKEPHHQKSVHLNSVKSSSNDQKRPTCEHCGKIGHTEDRCWAKHPDLKNSAPFKKARVNSVSSSSDIPNKEKVIKDAHNLVKSAQNNKSVKK